MASIIKKEPVEGTVNFIQHNLPGLRSGEYRLKVSQTVSTQAGAPLDNSYFFAVQSQRFQLNPADISATFPYDRALGEFNDTLPHIVLKRQTLPWMRYPTTDEPPVDFPDHKHEMDIPAWLGILLFDADDTAAFPGFDITAKSGKIRDLFIKQSAADQGQGYSYFYFAANLGPDSDPAALTEHLDYGETPDDPCQYIDVPMQLFWKIAPSADDLKMSAHVRNVDITKKATENGVPASRNDLSHIPGTSNFAIVVGNRLPQSGKRTFAHLVSLEGLAPFLPVDPAAKDTPDEITYPSKVETGEGSSFTINAGGFIRLVSLWSWSFTSVGDEREFEHLLMGLNPKNRPADNDLSKASPDFSMGLPAPEPAPTDTPAMKQSKNALAMGFTALLHQTRAGAKTVSWYRGPLLPYQVKTDILPDSFASSDAAHIYDPQTGMFDLSYSGAWQLGRLLSLQNKHFSAALYNWRRSNLRDCVSTMESIILGQTLDNIQRQLRDDSLIYPLLKAFLPAVPDGQGLRMNLASARTQNADAQRLYLADPDALTELMGSDLEVPFEIYSWLAKLKLLEGVPFNYLVPDERMLPPESIRFFYLDMNWINALIDGALSIGRNAAKPASSMDAAHDTAVKARVAFSLDGHARSIRRTALGLKAAPSNTPLEVISGFVIRSEVVRGWPGLEVNGYASDGSLMDIVRFERLAPTVLLCLFEKDGKTLAAAGIHEPAESLHFGVTANTPKSVNIRYNYQEGSSGPGSQVPGVYQTVPFRDAGANRVIRMFRLSRDLRAAQYAKYISDIYPGFDHLPSSEFAMQMLKGVGLVSFNIN